MNEQNLFDAIAGSDDSLLDRAQQNRNTKQNKKIIPFRKIIVPAVASFAVIVAVVAVMKTGVWNKTEPDMTSGTPQAEVYEIGTTEIAALPGTELPDSEIPTAIGEAVDEQAYASDDTVKAASSQESQADITAETQPSVTSTTAGYCTIVTDTFVITKVSGTYLELNKLVGNDAEKLIYSCDLGEFDGSADMNYKVGDTITLRYDSEVAETYPMQLSVREIL